MSEFEFIHDLRALADPAHALNFEDDAATMPAADVVCTDTLVEGLHFIGTEDPASLALKLLAVNVSDVVSMNARPTHALLNLSLPLRCDQSWRDAFVAGLKQACATFGLRLLGGDTTGSNGGLVMSATVMGVLEGRPLWKRSGARGRDLVCVSGAIGKGALGLRDMLNGQPETTFAQHYRQPQPRLDLLDTPGVGGCADVSDGLVADLGHICRASKVSAVLDLRQVPYADSDADLLQQLSGGDDYQLVFTLSPRAAMPEGCSVIGWVQEASNQGPVILRGPDDLVAAVRAKSGYVHF